MVNHFSGWMAQHGSTLARHHGTCSFEHTKRYSSNNSWIRKKVIRRDWSVAKNMGDVPHDKNDNIWMWVKMKDRPRGPQREISLV